MPKFISCICRLVEYSEHKHQKQQQDNATAYKAQLFEKLIMNYDYNIKVAVMGCVVNGPGEAAEADLAIAGGKGEGLLIKHGKIVGKIKEEYFLDTLKNELDHWSDN